MILGADASLPGPGLDLLGEQLGEERREVDGQAWFPVRNGPVRYNINWTGPTQPQPCMDRRAR
jgi:hypothetical protein